MPTQSVVESKVVGSSYQMTDARNLDDEVSLNMYFEPIVKQNDLQSKGILRSVNGTELSFEFDNDGNARGLYSTNFGFNGEPELWMVIGKNVYVKSGDDNPQLLGSQLSLSNGKVFFAETGGVERNLAIVESGLESGQIAVFSLDENDLANRKARIVETPKNPYRLDSEGNMLPVHPTTIVSMANRLIVNDKGTGQIFLSRPAAFGSGTIKVYQYNVYEGSTTTPPVATHVLGCDLAQVMARYENPISQIMYEDDGFTPDYYEADLRTEGKWNWLSDTGSYQYETALSYTGDSVVAMECINNNRLVVLGKRSFDIWELATDENGYYSISNSSTGNNIGCGAPFSVAKTNNFICWLGAGKDGYNGIWSIKDGTEPSKISTPALDRKLFSMSRTDDAIGYGYAHAGHIFYVISFPSENVTFVYDLTTGFWHNRSSMSRTTGLDEMWQPIYPQEFNGKQFFLTYSYNCLVFIKDKKFTEWDGYNIRRLRRFAPLVSAYSPVIFNELRIECGVGLTQVLQPRTYIDGNAYHETEGYNPCVMMRCSPNGLVFGNTITARLGRAGMYDAECRWQQLGLGKYFVVELCLTDPVDFYIFDSKIRYVASQRF